MPCYHPYKIKYEKFRFLTENNINKRFKGSFTPRDSYQDGFVFHNNYYNTNNTSIDPSTKLSRTIVHQYVECGKCYFCRSKKSNEWAMRVSQEFFMNNSKGAFITLTYKDEYLPYNNSVEKDDLQRFLKRLRHHIKKSGFNCKLKYFACGEYGTIRRRAHYHLILTGYNFSNKKLRSFVERSWSIEKKLSKSIKTYDLIGRVQVVSANASTIAYTTKYMIKDHDLFLNEEQYYAKYKKAPPFRLVSKGIGKSFCYKYLDSIIQNGFIVHNGYKLAIPRTYLRWIKNHIGSEKYYELIESKFNEYKKVNMTILALEHNVELDYDNFIFDDDVYNILNQSKLLPFYLNKLKEISSIYKERHKQYLISKREKSLKKLHSLDNVA